MKRAVAWLVLLFAASSVGATCSSSQKQIITTDVAKAVQCVAGQVAGGDVDPGTIAVACSPLVIEDVIALVQALLSGNTQTDGGGASALTDEMRQRYETVLKRGRK